MGSQPKVRKGSTKPVGETKAETVPGTLKGDRCYTVKTLALRLAVTPLTIYRLVDQGKLPAVRVGRAIRFEPDAVSAFLDSVRVGPKGLKE